MYLNCLKIRILQSWNEQTTGYVPEEIASIQKSNNGASYDDTVIR